MFVSSCMQFTPHGMAEDAMKTLDLLRKGSDLLCEDNKVIVVVLLK